MKTVGRNLFGKKRSQRHAVIVTNGFVRIQTAAVATEHDEMLGNSIHQLLDFPLHSLPVLDVSPR